MSSFRKTSKTHVVQRPIQVKTQESLGSVTRNRSARHLIEITPQVTAPPVSSRQHCGRTWMLLRYPMGVRIHYDTTGDNPRTRWNWRWRNLSPVIPMPHQVEAWACDIVGLEQELNTIGTLKRAYSPQLSVHVSLYRVFLRFGMGFLW